MRKPVEAGTRLEHHMYNGPFGSSVDIMAGEGLRARGPRLLSHQERPGWKQCVLLVTDCKVGRQHQGFYDDWNWFCSATGLAYD